MLKSKLQKLLLITSFIAATSCGHVTVYNRRVYGDLGAYGAHYAETLTNKTGDVSKAQWDRIRVGMLCMDSQAYTDAETAIDQACVLLKCDYQTRESLRQGFARVSGVVKKAKNVREYYVNLQGTSDARDGKTGTTESRTE